MMNLLIWASLGCAAVPCVLFLTNLRLYRRAPKQGSRASVSVLIPARNEKHSIEAAVRSVLANENVDLECIVLDDHSTDGTGEIVAAIAASDSRVRVESAPALPSGWCGKQHACWELSKRASAQILCFLDADVRLTPGALSRMVTFLKASGSPVVSGFPRQETYTPLEQLLIPLIHFILLGFLPVSRMRRSTNPGYASGCGQLMMVRRPEYEAAGGHSAIRTSLHDGIKLPAAFRKAGFRSDIFDATDIATCRMYTNASAVWSGLAKNATEGIAGPGPIAPFTVILICGQVLPFFLLPAAPALMAIAIGMALLPRAVAAVRFRQPVLGVILHPVGITLLLSIQWYAFTRRLLGRPAGWKDRIYNPA